MAIRNELKQGSTTLTQCGLMAERSRSHKRFRIAILFEFQDRNLQSFERN